MIAEIVFKGQHSLVLRYDGTQIRVGDLTGVIVGLGRLYLKVTFGSEVEDAVEMGAKWQVWESRWCPMVVDGCIRQQLKMMRQIPEVFVDATIVIQSQNAASVDVLHEDQFAHQMPPRFCLWEGAVLGDARVDLLSGQGGCDTANQSGNKNQ